MAEGSAVGAVVELFMVQLEQREQLVRGVVAQLSPGPPRVRLGDLLEDIDAARVELGAAAADRRTAAPRLYQLAGHLTRAVAAVEAAVWDEFRRLAREQRAVERGG